MFPFKESKPLDVDDFLLLLAKRVCRASLADTLRAIHDSRNQIPAFRGHSADRVFSRLLDLSRSNSEAVEFDLFIRNTPPRLGETVLPEQLTWSLICGIAFKLNPILETGFCSRLIDLCLKQPTYLAFALTHGDAVASLAQYHREEINSSLIEVIIDSTDDSRALYALKIARWVPIWSVVRDAALNAMLSENVPKRLEAMWLTNDRGTCDEVIAFAEKRGLVAFLKDASGIRNLSRAIVESDGKSCSYAIKMATEPMSAAEDKKLSELLKRTLNDRNEKPQ